MGQSTTSEELHVRLRRPAPRRLRVAAWAVALLAAGPTAINLPGVIGATGSLHNLVGVAAAFGTYVALLLAAACMVPPELQKRLISHRRALLGLLLSLASLLLFPLSYAVVVMSSFDRWEFIWR